MKILRMLIMPLVVSLKIIEWIFRTSAKVIVGTAHGIKKCGDGVQTFMNHGALVILSVLLLFLASFLVGVL